MKKIFLTSIIFFILGGCNNYKVQNNSNEQLVHVKNSSLQETNRKTRQEISKHLVSLATSIPHVNDAAAVVLGRYAFVGIDVDSKINRTEVGSIKYSVAEALKKDPNGAHSIVVADPDTTQRLKNISGEIKRGKPIQGIMNELAEVAGRLMPELPSQFRNSRP